MNYTYLLRCADDTLYCGWTNDLARRLAAHNAGNGGKYTRVRRPVRLVWWEAAETKEEAMRREYRIKRLPRREKLRLVESFGRIALPGDSEGGAGGTEAARLLCAEESAGGYEGERERQESNEQ